MKEQWKDISGYENIYQVSNIGNVRRIFNPKNIKAVNYILKQAIDNSGYNSVLLSVDGYKKRFLVHRLVALTFIKNLGSKPIVNHLDFNKHNNNVDNLEWCTQKENAKHANDNGHIADNKGEKHGMSKLTEKEVLEIRERAEHETGFSIANDYGISTQTVYQIINRSRWKHI